MYIDSDIQVTFMWDWFKSLFPEGIYMSKIKVKEGAEESDLSM